MPDETITPDPNDQMVEPIMGDEDMDKWLASIGADEKIDLPALMSTPARQFGQEGDNGGTDDAPNDAPDDTTNGDDAPETPETPVPDDHVVVNGVPVARADIERLYNFDQYLRNNPEAAQRVAQAVAPNAAQPPVPEPTAVEPAAEFKPPDPPDYLDLEDPVQKFTWESHVTTQRQIFDRDEQQKKFFAQQAADRQKQINQQAQVDMDLALTNFRTTFPGLNDDEVAIIRREAGPLVPAMMAQHKPVDALYKSMEVAAYANTDLRTKLTAESTPTPTNKQRSTTRKAKLSSISGTPRSAPKVDTRASFANDRDMVNAFATELNDAMTGR